MNRSRKRDPRIKRNHKEKREKSEMIKENKRSMLVKARKEIMTVTQFVK